MLRYIYKMCYNCGCTIPDDNMGSDDNITEKTLHDLSHTWGKGIDETKRELLSVLTKDDPRLKEDPLKSMFEKAASSWGQSVEEAKKNTASLLKSQFR